MLMNCLAQMNGEMSELCLYLLIFKLYFLPQLIKTGGLMTVVDVQGYRRACSSRPVVYMGK